MLLKNQIHPIIGLENLNEDSQSVLEETIISAQSFLNQFAASDVFLQQITSIFGNSFDGEKLTVLRENWLNSNFETIPEIEIRSQSELNGSNGAFAASTNKIYLSEEYISQNSFNSGAIVDVLLEEVGHFIDANINKADTAGDEGEIFSAVVRGVELDETTIQALKGENDTGVINIKGQTIQVEKQDKVIISGTIFWQEPNTNNTFPVRESTIQIRDVNSNEIISQEGLITDDKGNYTLNFDKDLLSNNQEIYIQIETSGSFREVQDINNQVYSYKSDYFQVTDSAITFDIVIPNNDKKLISAFSISEAIYTGAKYATVVSGEKPKSILVISDKFPEVDAGAFYTNGTDTITIEDPANGFEWDVILHEYGHFLEELDELIPSKRTIVGSRIHRAGESNITGVKGDKDLLPLGKDSGVRLAWSEGLATYLGIAAQFVADRNNFLPRHKNIPNGDTIQNVLDSSYSDRTISVIDGVEETKGDANTNKGEGDEAAVFRILWDIADEANESHDEIAVGHEQLYRIIDDEVERLLKLPVNQRPNLVEGLNFIWDYFSENPDALGLPNDLSNDAKFAKLGAIFEEYDVSPSPKILQIGEEPLTIQWERNNNNDNDEFEVIIFNEDFSQRIIEANNIVVNDNTQKLVEWKPSNEQWELIKDNLDDYQFVVTGSDNRNRIGGNLYRNPRQRTGAYWSGAKSFTVDSTETLSNDNLSSELVKNLIEKINGFFSNLANTIDGEIFSNDIPLIGNIFSNDTESPSTESTTQSSPIPQNASENTNNPLNFIQQIQEAIVKELEGLQKLGAEEIKQALNNALGETGKGLNILKNISDKSNSDEIKFNLELGSEKSIVNKPLAADIGLPFLGLKIGEEKESQLKVGLDYDFNFTFGVNKKTGEFIFETPEEEDLKINLETSIPDFDVDGTLGFLKFDITDEDADNDSSNDGEDSNGDGINPTALNFSLVADLEGVEVKDFKTDGFADINLNLKTNLVGLEALPSIKTDLNIDWNFGNVDSIPSVAFNNIQLDLGSFFNDFIDPVFGKIQQAFEPIQPVVDVLNAKLPVLDDLGRSFLDANEDNRVTLVDIAQKLPIKGFDVDLGYIDAVIQFAELIDNIPKNSNGIFIDLGDFNLDGENILSPNFDLSALEIEQLNINKIADSIEEQLNNLKNTNTPNASEAVEFIAGFSGGAGELRFPILEDPETVFGILLGKKDIPLFTYDVPSLGLKAAIPPTGSPPFFFPLPVFPAVGVELQGNTNASIDLAFGYDTFGLQQLAKGSDGKIGTGDDFTPSNAEDLLAGFYINDTDENGEDVAEATLGAGIDAYAAFNAGIVSGGVGGGIDASIDIDLNDKDGDGKFRPATELDECLFELSGALTAGLKAFIRIGFGIFSFKKNFNIAKATLLSFEAGCRGDDEEVAKSLARNENTNGKEALILHMGDEAGKREVEPEQEEEVFLVQLPESAPNGTVEVSAFGVVKKYENIGEITADAGSKDDTIVISDNILLPTSLNGGDGNDQIYGGANNDVLSGGKQDDALFGSLGNDTLLGGDNDDYLVGGIGADILDGGKGKDQTSYLESSEGVIFTFEPDEEGFFIGQGGDAQGDKIKNIEYIEGSNFDDRLVGDNNNNTFEGLGGNDFLSGGGGDDYLIGGAGADTLDGGNNGKNGDGTTYVSSFAPVYIDLENNVIFGGDADGDKLYSIENIQTTVYDDILIGNDADNFFDGFAGNDQINGGDGNDSIDAGLGDDTVIGGAGKDILNGDGGEFQNDSPGEDWVSYASSSDGVKVSLKTGKASGGDAEGDKLLFSQRIIKNDNSEEETKFEESEYNSFENLEGSNFNDTLLEGDIGNNKIEGLSGDDVIKGDQGDDTLIGGAGADNLDGGSGFDWADYSDSPEGVSVNLNENFGEGGHAEGDTFKRKKKEDLEISIFSLSSPFLNLPSSGSDTTDSAVENLLGSDFADSLVGDSGNNKINPGLGNGTDFVNGFEGSDRLIIDYSRDDVGTGIRGGYNLGSGTNGFLSRNRKDGSSLKDAVSFENIEEIQVIGTFKDDEIYGGVGNDEINSGGGNDTIYGGKGKNIILAEDGDDVVVDQTDINREINWDEQFYDSSNNSGFIFLNGGKGIDTLSVDLSSEFDDIILESASPLVENPNQLLTFDNGSAITNFEIFKNIRTGRGNDKLTQLGRINNEFASGFGSDTVNPGLGFDRVDGGEVSNPYASSPPYESDLLILDYSTEDTGTGIFYFNDGDERTSVNPREITKLEDLIENTDKNQLSKIAKNYVSKRGFYARATVEKTSILDQVEFKNFEYFNITGTSKSDYLVGGGKWDTLIGKNGNDILIGNRGSDTLEGGNGDDILIGTTGSFVEDTVYGRSIEEDTLTGGEGADQFWLGTNKSAYTPYKSSDSSSISGNNNHVLISDNRNYALITDFNPNEGDTINLYSCDPSNPKEYSLGSSPQNLPLGTAIFNENKLVAIVQGANSLSLDGNYFSFIQDDDSPLPVTAI